MRCTSVSVPSADTRRGYASSPVAVPSSFSFLHAADLHLDTPFLGVEARSEALARMLRDASLHAFDALVELAIDRQVAFVLLAGDLYDGSERGVRAQLRFLDGVRRLAEAGIATFVVYGNHDPLDEGWSAITTSWPDAVTIFPAEGPLVVPVFRDGAQVATVQGLSYARRETSENLAHRLKRPQGPGLHIGLLHCNVAGSSSLHANYSPCSLANLHATGLDYLALGHVHDRRVLSGGAPGEPWVVYPGNTQARSMAETGAKGAYVVHVVRGAVDKLEFTALDSIRFRSDELDCSAIESIGDLEARIAERSRELLEQEAPRSVVWRVTLVGRCSIHRALRGAGAVEDLAEALRARESATPPRCHLERIVDATTPELDVDELRGRGDFASDLLRVSDELASDALGLDELIAELRALVPAKLRRPLDSLAADASWRADVLRAARMLALDALEEDR